MLLSRQFKRDGIRPTILIDAGADINTGSENSYQ